MHPITLHVSLITQHGDSHALPGVRGATSVDDNTSEAILRETRRMLALLIHLNGIQAEDVTSIFFTTTRT